MFRVENGAKSLREKAKDARQYRRLSHGTEPLTRFGVKECCEVAVRCTEQSARDVARATSQPVLSFPIIRLFHLFVEHIGISRLQECHKEMSINEAITLQIDTRPFAIRTIKAHDGNLGPSLKRLGDAKFEPRPLPQL